MLPDITMSKSIAVSRHLKKDVLSFFAKDSLAQLALLSVFFLSLLHVFFGVSFYYPGIRTVGFIFKHYIGPVFVLLLLSPFLFNVSLFDFVCTSLSLFIIICVHFNMKLISMILTNSNYDNIYFISDIQLRGILETFYDVYYLFRLDAVRDWHLYHNIFVFLFFFAFFLGARHGYFKRIVLATSILMLIGGASYSFGAAYGPFIFDLPNALPTQKMMFSFYFDFVKSNGLLYKPENFVSPLGAMPSLHIGNTMLFLLFAAKYENSTVRIVYYLALFFFCVAAATLKWHYLVDFIAGVILAIISCWASDLWSNKDKPNYSFAYMRTRYKAAATVSIFFILLLLRVAFD